MLRRASFMRHIGGLSSDDDRTTLDKKRNAVGKRKGDNDSMLLGLSFMPLILPTTLAINTGNTRRVDVRDLT
jgi:hypothetical protein